MSTLNLEHEKLSLIAWITELQDTKLIKKLKDFQTKNNDIPQWQKDIVLERIKAVENGTMKTRSWEEAKKEVFKK